VSADLPLDFQGLYFESGLDGSNGAVTLLNKSDKGIQYYVAIMEFFDEKENYLISAPVYNVVEEDQTIPLDVPFKPWLQRNWPGGPMAPIAAKSTSRETFNNVLAMLTCPASVRVALIQLRYDDGTGFKYVSPTLRLSTTPGQKMEIHDPDGAQRWQPLTVVGTLEVDVQGRARILELDAADVFRKWLQNEFSQWKFVPARVEGKPASSRLPFIFYLGDTTHPWVSVEAMRRRGARGAILVWPTFP